MNKLIKTYRWIIQPLLVLAILIFGFIGAMSFSLFKDEPEKSDRASYVPLVRVIETTKSTEQVTVRGTGTLEARTRINIVPQVGGKVTYIHPQLRAGGVFDANEVLLQIEKIDYQLAVTQQEAEVAKAQTAIKLEIAEADAAREEWLEINPEQDIPTLVGREPQINEAKAALDSAKAQLKQARLNLERTSIYMPFTGRIVEAAIDVGEVITANQSIGTVYDSERLEIPISMNVKELAWIDVPDSNNERSGNSVDISVNIGDQEHILKGEVTRIESELEEISRFAKVVVTLFTDQIPASLKPKVIPGLFVNVSIFSQQFAEVTSLPRASLREGDVLWTIEEGKLKFTIPEIVYESDSEIVVRQLEQGTQVVMSDLNVVTEGMSVRVEGDS